MQDNLLIRDNIFCRTQIFFFFNNICPSKVYKSDGLIVFLYVSLFMIFVLVILYELTYILLIKIYILVGSYLLVASSDICPNVSFYDHKCNVYCSKYVIYSLILCWYLPVSCHMDVCYESMFCSIFISSLTLSKM